MLQLFNGFKIPPVLQEENELFISILNGLLFIGMQCHLMEFTVSRHHCADYCIKDRSNQGEAGVNPCGSPLRRSSERCFLGSPSSHREVAEVCSSQRGVETWLPVLYCRTCASCMVGDGLGSNSLES